MSRLWEQIRDRRSSLSGGIAYEWFTLALDMLYVLGAVDLHDGQLRRMRPKAKAHAQASS